MKKLALLLMLTFTVVTIGCSCSYNAIKGNGNEVTKEINVSDFSKIDASHAFDIEVVVGRNRDVKIETDENLMKYIEVFVENNTLYLQVESNINFKGDVKAYI